MILYDFKRCGKQCHLLFVGVNGSRIDVVTLTGFMRAGGRRVAGAHRLETAFRTKMRAVRVGMLLMEGQFFLPFIAHQFPTQPFLSSIECILFSSFTRFLFLLDRKKFDFRL